MHDKSFIRMRDILFSECFQTDKGKQIIKNFFGDECYTDYGNELLIKCIMAHELGHHLTNDGKKVMEALDDFRI